MSKAIIIAYTNPIFHIRNLKLESFVWNIIIRAIVQNVSPPPRHSPISVYLRMRNHCVRPDFHTFPFLLPSFNNPIHLPLGHRTHAQILLFGLDQDPFVRTSLLNMYSSCGDLTSAQRVFDESVSRDLPAWNSLVNAYAKAGLVDDARKLFDDARKLFDEMPERNVISWSCLINGYFTCGKYKEALHLFREMQLPKPNEAFVVKPNEFTLSTVLSACGRLGALQQGKWVHAYIDKYQVEIDVVLGTALIDMYAKCGSLERAKRVFSALGSKKDVQAYSAMICCLAMYGLTDECFQLFSEMATGNNTINPNSVTFVGILGACVHQGLVNEGESYFTMMTEKFGITPSIQHYGCMVDLYGRAGLIEEAESFIASMPMEPDVLIWGSLLSGSRMLGDIKTCEAALKRIIQLDPMNSGAYVLLSNVYAKTGRWIEVKRTRHEMEVKGIKKVPGCSSVEVEGVIHEFVVGDESHKESEKIYAMLNEIMHRLREAGYVSDIKEVLLDLDEEGKEMVLSYHSEKLAIAFCLMKTRHGTPVRIIKNLRICGDCHLVMKMISKLYSREIVVRDCNRFHHFNDGSCSCRDFW
ncbi:PREDICTED: pentatricopeptide repeat-containing protein At3g62890-like [Camelina sativa]|uniref:Pentatricopeptide repeat-containing protein At3g62890-like n=1 Tax=Camelina sativa TaxID=90675 RepID=A0ABM0WC19_CAMSA|nr:PREDICTED: pentatricopeptide repeat-containing protein At3g62890-like [Camelina sativa]